MKLQRIATLARKESREILRDRLFFVLALVVPATLMLTLGYGLTTDMEDIPIAILDHDRTPLSREYAHKFIGSRYFDFRGYLQREGQIDSLISGERVRVVVVIPPRFQRDLRHGRTVAVQSVISGTIVQPAETCIVLGATAFALLVVVRGLLDVALHGNVVAYLALSAVFAMNASGIGLLIATFSRNLAQVGFLSLLVMPPMNLFAGTITPLESMPLLLKPVMLLSPMYHYLNVSFGLLLEGAPLAELWDSVLALFAIGTGLFALGAWRFRREFR